MVAQIGHLHSN